MFAICSNSFVGKRGYLHLPSAVVPLLAEMDIRVCGLQ
jgi:hypothetical protein